MTAMSRSSRIATVGLVIVGGLAPAIADPGPAAKAASTNPAPRTSLGNPRIQFTIPDKPYAVLDRGPIRAVVVDNREVDDAVLPGHRAGYHGIGSLTHAKQSRNLFVPAYAGLNFEHIHDGTVHPREVLFEPRHAPMQVRVINSHTAELHQPPTPHWGLESCLRYELTESGAIDVTFECIPRRATWTNDYLGLFWASYINQPESLDIHFLAAGATGGANGSEALLRRTEFTPPTARSAMRAILRTIPRFPSVSCSTFRRIDMPSRGSLANAAAWPSPRFFGRRTRCDSASRHRAPVRDYPPGIFSGSSRSQPSENSTSWFFALRISRSLRPLIPAPPAKPCAATSRASDQAYSWVNFTVHGSPVCV